MDREVKVLVDGKELPLVPFVQELIGNTVAAMIGSLKGAEDAETIDLSLVMKKH